MISSQAGNVAEEVISGIRTVVAYHGQEKESQRYGKNLTSAHKIGIQLGVAEGVTGGLTYLCMMPVFYLVFWYGTNLMMDSKESDECKKCFGIPLNKTVDAKNDLFECIKECMQYDAKDFLAITYGMMFGVFYLGQSSPQIGSITAALQIARKIYRIIDQVPSIDILSDKGEVPSTITGNISFRNVFFHYPSRPNTQILKGLSFDIPAGLENVLFKILKIQCMFISSSLFSR